MALENWRGPVIGAGNMDELRSHWFLFLCFGIGLMIVGAMAVGAAVAVTYASVVLFGAILLVGGIIELIRSIWTRHSGGFTLHLLTGLLYGVLGALMLTRPTASALTLTLMLAMLFGVAGVFRIVAATSIRYRGWGWTVFSGVIAILLGIALVGSWPVSGLWAIGTFVGIDMICYGWSTIMLSLLARTLPAERAKPGEEPGRLAA